MIKTEKGVTEMRTANEPELLTDFSCIVKAVKDRLGEDTARMAFEIGLKSDEEIAEMTERVRKLMDELMGCHWNATKGRGL